MIVWSVCVGTTMLLLLPRLRLPLLALARLKLWCLNNPAFSRGHMVVHAESLVSKPARPPVRRSAEGGQSDWPGGIVPGTSCSALPSSMVDDSTGNLNKRCRAEGNSPSLTWYIHVGGWRWRRRRRVYTARGQDQVKVSIFSSSLLADRALFSSVS